MPHTAVSRKINASNVFNCKDLSQLKAAIARVLPYKGISNSRFYTCELSGVKFLTKLCFYRLTDPQPTDPNVMHSADAEIRILERLKLTIVDQNLSPCILEMIYNKVCENIAQMTPNRPACNKLLQSGMGSAPSDDLVYSLCRYSELVDKDLALDKCAFLVLDTCDITLGEYMGRGLMTPINYAVFKSILFMIIHAFYVIRKVYPQFQHYDLHTDNIMLKLDAEYVFNPAKPMYMVFPVGKEKYYVPYFGITPKIIDFGNSSLPEEGAISSATTDKMHMHYRAQNDLLLLFYWIYATLDAMKIETGDPAISLLHKLEPNGTFKHYHTESIRAIEDRIPTYEQMVTNPVWGSYRTARQPPNIYCTFSAPTEVYEV